MESSAAAVRRQSNLRHVAASLAGILDWLGENLGVLCGVLIVVTAVILSSNAVARYILRAPMGWTLAASSYVLLVSGFLGGMFVVLADGHVRLDIVRGRLPLRVQAIIDICTSLLFAIPFLVWLDWLFLGFALQALELRETEVMVGWPLFPVKLMMPLGTTLMIIQILVTVVRKIVFLKTGKMWVSRAKDAIGPGGE